MALKLSDVAPGAAGQPQPAETVALSDAQFDKIVELLTPGYEISKLMLADYKLQQEGREAYAAAERAGIEAAQKAADEAANAGPKG